MLSTAMGHVPCDVFTHGYGERACFFFFVLVFGILLYFILILESLAFLLRGEFSFESEIDGSGIPLRRRGLRRWPRFA